MIIFLVFFAFLAGAALTAVFFLLRRPKQQESDVKSLSDERMIQQWSNFFAYDGTGKGQIKLEDKENTR